MLKYLVSPKYIILPVNCMYLARWSAVVQFSKLLFLVVHGNEQFISLSTASASINGLHKDCKSLKVKKLTVNAFSNPFVISQDFIFWSLVAWQSFSRQALHHCVFNNESPLLQNTRFCIWCHFYTVKSIWLSTLRVNMFVLMNKDGILGYVSHVHGQQHTLWQKKLKWFIWTPSVLTIGIHWLSLVFG